MPHRPFSFLPLLFKEHEGHHHGKILKTIKAKADARRTRGEKLADWMTGTFGSATFLTINILIFIFWILVNINAIPGIAPFDPFPFNLLTTVVSLEAIFLAIFVLISQNRTAKVDDLREEIHLQINLIAEKEITKIGQMLAILLEKNGVDLSNDPELKKLLRPVSEDEIERRLEKEIL
jgi:uncharacterized membrane protein